MLKKCLALLMLLVTLAAPLMAQAEFNVDRPIAYMDIKFECGCKRGGTGAMVSRRALLTAAHNLYCHTHGQKLKSCNFYFGATSKSKCYYKYTGKFNYYAYTTFGGGYYSMDDIGYVLFESNVGEKTGWFACQVPNDQMIENEFFHAYSYDAKRKLQWTWDLAYPDDAWEMKMPFSFSGTEGGPITYTAENAEFPAVIGVYTSKGSDGLSYIRRLTLDVFNDMKANGAFN